MVEYSFSAAGNSGPAFNTYSDTPCKSSLYSKILAPAIQAGVNGYHNNPETMLSEDAMAVTVNEGFNQLSTGFSEIPFTTVTAVQYQSSDYYPVYPGTLWEYIKNGSSEDTARVLPKLVDVNGAMTSVFLCKCGDKEYYTSDSNGILLHRIFAPDVSIPNIGVVNITATLIPPLKIADGIISIGQTFQSSGIVKYNNLPTVGILKLPYNASFSFISTDNITVPAGNFDVLNISGDLTIQGQSNSQTFYVAKDIGIVKQISNSNTLELESFYYAELLSPSTGEIIPSGTTYTINWETSTDTAFFKLFYSTDKGTTWYSITPDLVTGTSYDWEVPSPKNNKTACLIKIIGYDSDRVEKTSFISKPFTIEVVKLTSPDGGETLTSSTSWPITWTTNETKTPVANVILQYTINNGMTWKTITRITGGNPGTYDWNIPVVSREKTKCKVKIILQNANGKVVGTDMSDDYFTISP